MIDHIGIAVTDYPRSRAFYARVLATLGLAAVMEVGERETGPGGYQGCGFGPAQKPEFWLGNGGGNGNGSPDRSGGSGVHVAFAAPSRAAVDAFHAEALAAGGRDNGAPGLRPHYHPDYYAAFVLDPDGNNLEAVCHRPG